MNPRWWLIPLTVAVALMLAMVPLPAMADPFRPDWVAMVAIYWAMATPRRFGLLAGWIAGLLLDVALGNLLGQNGLGLVLAVAFVERTHQRLRVFPVAQQTLVVVALLLLKQAMVMWTSGMAGRAPADPWLYFVAPLTAIVFWPIVFTILRDLRRRYQS